MARRTKSAGTLLLGFALVLVLGACYEHTYTVGDGAPNGRTVYESWRHHWLGGLISPDQHLELEDVCPSGHATIHQEMTFLNGLVSALTSGIYSPTTVEVRCRRGRRSDLQFSAADVERIVAQPEFLDWVLSRAPALYEDAAAAQDALPR